MITGYKELEDKLSEVQEALFQFLRDNKIAVPDKKIATLLKGLEDVQVMVPGHKYVTVQRDELGFIIGYTIADGISARVDEIPEDLFRGYYTMDDTGRFVRDEEKYERYWRTFY